MSLHVNVESGNDPRRPSAAKRYVAPAVAPQDLPIDYMGFIPSYSASPYKLSSRLALIFCAQSLVNMRNMENDLKQVMMAMTFSMMGLITNYLGPARPGEQTGDLNF